MATTANPNETTANALVIERTFDAPRDLVWRAWSEPDLFMRWWGPRDYSCPACKIDFRVGGSWLACMRSTEGQDIWSTGKYREIVPQERIVCTDNFADADGNVVPATHYGIDADFASEMIISVTLEESNGKTRMTLRHTGLPAGEHSEGANEGWNQSLDKLAESLAKA